MGKSTKQVAKILGVPLGKLSRIVWEERITPPEKGPGNSFWWTDEDINRASRELLGKVYKPAYADTTASSEKRQLSQGAA